MKLTKLEKITLGLTAVALAFLAGWYLSRQDQSAQPITPLPATPVPSPTADAPAIPSDALVVNINTATVQELETLPGIGAKKAADIVAYRKANGPFPVVESLTDVPGIGANIMEQCDGLLTVED